MTRRSSTPDEVVQFAGLTSHNNVELSEKAADAASGDHSRDNGFYPVVSAVITDGCFGCFVGQFHVVVAGQSCELYHFVGG